MSVSRYRPARAANLELTFPNLKGKTMDWIRDFTVNQLMENWPLIAMGVFAIAALGTLLGFLKKLAANIFEASIRVSETATDAMLSKRGLRVVVPVALAGTLFGSGWWVGASRQPKVVYLESEPQVITRVQEKEVVKEVPTYIEKIVEKIVRVPVEPIVQKPAEPVADAKCSYCGALFNIENVLPELELRFRTKRDQGYEFNCGGCATDCWTDSAKSFFKNRRNSDLEFRRQYAKIAKHKFVIMPVGRDPVPNKPLPPQPLEILLKVVASETETERKLKLASLDSPKEYDLKRIEREVKEYKEKRELEVKQTYETNMKAYNIDLIYWDEMVQRFIKRE